jgi:S-(hydroxymethyl)glutathione dehydrogenase/alcohol dehydrogenase
MKAAVCREFGKPLTIEDVVLAPPGTGEVKVRLAACAICHSDISFMRGEWGGALPAVYGHEAAGVVEAVGPGVAGLAPGDHVVVTLVRFCGQCRYCSDGTQVQCETSFPLDKAGPIRTKDGAPLFQAMRTGAFAEFVTVHASQAVAIAKDIPLDVASLLACGVITGFGAVANTADLRLGSTAVVIGAGGVGLNSIQAIALREAERNIVIDLSDAKLEAAKRFGATDTINPTREDAQARVMELTQGRGVDYVFVTVGAKAAFDQAPAMLARGGALVLVGMPPNGVMSAYDPGTFAALNQRILGTKMGSTRTQVDIPHLVELYRKGRLKLDELITGRYSLAQVNEAVESVERGEALRNVIVFNSQA